MKFITKLQELLRGKNEGVRFRVSNGSAVKSSEDVTDSPKNKSKFKHKDRKNRSKSITAETRPGIFTKLRGKTDTEVNPKTPENIDVDVRAEERLNVCNILIVFQQSEETFITFPENI
jgi:hypothetical protein